jgi:hypothetical protein
LSTRTLQDAPAWFDRQIAGVLVSGAAQSRRRRIVWALVTAVLYGAAMGSSDARALQMVYSGLKLPLLLGVTFLISLPSFFLINAIAGVGRDFGRVVSALLASQAVLTVVLCSFAPVILFWYASSPDHEWNLLFNVILFAIASGASQFALRRHYAPLIASAAVHSRLMKLWVFVYAFVGIQSAWVLRPFVGDPSRPTQFLRDDPWTNAYVWVARMIGRVVLG